jgi:hypothetical protein
MRKAGKCHQDRFAGYFSDHDSLTPASLLGGAIIIFGAWRVNWN